MIASLLYTLDATVYTYPGTLLDQHKERHFTYQYHRPLSSSEIGEQ
jgi:hypothetical protein